MTVAIGIDGCKEGWFWFRFDGDAGRFGAADSIAEILDRAPADARALIDIPVGLKERGKTERDCDLLAREMLRPRRPSSVFPAPCRQALRQRDYAAASDKNQRITGRALSRQSWGLAAKIREVDEYLRGSERARSMLFESHPEVVFCGLAGGPMQANKKTRDGFAERMTILQIFEPDAQTWIASAFLAHGGFEATRDDVVDAYALALCAKHPARWRTLPDAPVTDPKGLNMNIVYMTR
jgi:predicted RNase H-like nuclease